MLHFEIELEDEFGRDDISNCDNSTIDSCLNCDVSMPSVTQSVEFLIVSEPQSPCHREPRRSSCSSAGHQRLPGSTAPSLFRERRPSAAHWFLRIYGTGRSFYVNIYGLARLKFNIGA